MEPGHCMQGIKTAKSLPEKPALSDLSQGRRWPRTRWCCLQRAYLQFHKTHFLSEGPRQGEDRANQRQPKDPRVSKPTPRPPHRSSLYVVEFTHRSAMYLAKLLVGTDHLNPSQPCSTNYRLFSYLTQQSGPKGVLRWPDAL